MRTASTSPKATAAHPPSSVRHVPKPLASTTKNAAAGATISEADETSRYSPSIDPARPAGAAATTAAVAAGKYAASPAACAQRTSSTCQNSAHSASSGPVTT